MIRGDKASSLEGKHLVYVGLGEILTQCDSGHLLL